MPHHLPSPYEHSHIDEQAAAEMFLIGLALSLTTVVLGGTIALGGAIARRLRRRIGRQ